MFLHISNDVVAGFDENNASSIALLEIALSLHARRFHYVGLSRVSVRVLEAKLDGKLSALAKTALRLISSQSVDLNSLRAKINFYLEVDETIPKLVLPISLGSQTYWKCSLEVACTWLSCPLKILGENITDTKMFVEAARQYSISAEMELAMMRCTREMAGGTGQMDEVLEERLHDGIAPVLCIIDSDKLYPSHGGSSAIKKCEQVINGNPGPGFFYALNERELENILPLQFMQGAIDQMNISPERDVLLDSVKKLAALRNAQLEVYCHIDIKNGTCDSWVKSKKEAAISHFSAAKIDGVCGCVTECKGLISPPILENILEKVLTYLGKISPRQAQKMAGSADHPAWERIGEAVYFMGFCNHIRVT